MYSNYDKIDDVTGISPYLIVEVLQCIVNPFDIQNCAIKKPITFSALSTKEELNFIMRYHRCSIEVLKLVSKR